MKKILLICTLFLSFTASAQFPTRDSLRLYINKWIRNSAVEAFSNLRLNSSMNGMLDFMTLGNQNVINVDGHAALRAFPKSAGGKTFLFYNNGVNNYFRYDSSDNSSADDTAMLVVGAGGARYKRLVDNSTLDPRWFGAIPNDGVDDYAAIQKCINYAIKNSYKKIVFPGGEFTLSKGLVLWKDNNNDGIPEFVNLTIEGHNKSHGGATLGETALRVTNSSNFAIGIVRGKACLVKNITIYGTNQLNYSSDLATAWNTSTTYVKDSQRTNRYSPYSGIVLDPFGGSEITSGNRYPGFESYYAVSYYTLGVSGSTNCKFENVTINGFICGVVLSPNGHTQNNESHTFDDLWIDNCKTAFSTCNSQERNTVIRNIRCWESVQTVFTNNEYGAQKGDPISVDGANFAGNIFQLFNISGWGIQEMEVKNIYAESFYRIGTIGNVRTISFNSCNFHFGVTPTGTKIQDWLYSGSTTAFNNSVLLFYNENTLMIPMNFAGTFFKFENCYLNNPVSTYYNQHTVNNAEIIYKNCHFYSKVENITDSYTYGVNDLYKDGMTVLRKFIDLDEVNATFSNGLGATQYRRVKSPMQKIRFLGTVSLTVNGDTAYANIPELAGKTQFVNTLVLDPYQGEISGEILSGRQCMRIKSIDGSGNVVFDHVISRIPNGTANRWLYLEDYQKLSEPYLFDYNGSTMSNVYRESSTSAATLSTSGIYYYLNTMVTISSSSAGSATPLVAPVASVKRGILSSYVYDEYGYSWGNPISNIYFNDGVLFTSGSFYENVKPTDADSLILGFRCIKSGVKGSAAAPEFETVYRSRKSGSGYQLAGNGTNQIKSLTTGYGITLDSSTANQVKIKLDSSTVMGSIPAVTEGTYEPTKYNISNVDSVRFSTCSYQKIGGHIYVYGEVYVDPTSSSTDTEFDMSIPVSTAVNYTYSLSGNGSSHDVSNPVRIYGNTSDYRAKFRFKSSDNSGHTYSFTYSYKLDTGL